MTATLEPGERIERHVPVVGADLLMTRRRRIVVRHGHDFRPATGIRSWRFDSQLVLRIGNQVYCASRCQGPLRPCCITRPSRWRSDHSSPLPVDGVADAGDGTYLAGIGGGSGRWMVLARLADRSGNAGLLLSIVSHRARRQV